MPSGELLSVPAGPSQLRSISLLMKMSKNQLALPHGHPSHGGIKLSILSPRRRRAEAALWRAAQAEGTSGEMTEERGNQEKCASSPQPSPPSDGGEGETEELDVPLHPTSNRTHWSRRKFVSTLAQSTAVGVALGSSGLALAATESTRRTSRPRKIAILATEVRKLSHAQHFIDRFLEGYGWEGRHHHPPMKLAGLYVDQFADNDLSRERARRHHVKLCPTVAEALTLGTSKLAVDGVLLIGEHGTYPRNEKAQTLYPRHRMFLEIVEVFKASGRAVPVFNDKHLSTDWNECVDMVRTAKELGFPFLAGSSLPVTWRLPAVEIPLHTPLTESVCVGYGGIDSYDFHGLETAQCMSERRAGGEVGVKSVHAVRGQKVWEMLEARETTQQAFFSAVARSHTCRAGSGYTYGMPDLDWLQEQGESPLAYFIEHLDGFRTSLFILNGLVGDFNYGGLVKDANEVFSCQMYLPMPPARATLADFFNPLSNNIERMILEGVAPYPVERTLLTSGMVLSAVESLYRGQVPLDTPELKVAYQAAADSTYWRA